METSNETDCAYKGTVRQLYTRETLAITRIITHASSNNIKIISKLQKIPENKNQNIQKPVHQCRNLCYTNLRGMLVQDFIGRLLTKSVYQPIMAPIWQGGTSWQIWQLLSFGSSLSIGTSSLDTGHGGWGPAVKHSLESGITFHGNAGTPASHL